MSGQSGPGWWQASDGQWYPPHQYPQTHTPAPPSGTPENLNNDGPKKNSRSFGERVNTTQGIVVIISTLVTLIFGGGSVALVIRHFTSHKPTSTPTPTPTHSFQGLTIDQVRNALLTSSDLTIIDPNLTSSDVAPPLAGSCKALTAKPAFNVNREFKDGTTLILADGIQIFNSSNDAHAGLEEDSQQVTCSFTGVESVSSISGELRGICDESAAWKITNVNNNGTTVSSYLGVIRCGRALTIFGLATPQGSSFDSNYNFDTSIEMTVPKITKLLQPST